MSRQRREKKARDKELSRQMDLSVTKEGVTQERLTENGRITELKWRAASWSLQDGKRGFWQKKADVHHCLLLYVVERHRTRLVGQLQLAGTLPKSSPAEIPFDLVQDHHPLQKISYARPAHFLCFSFSPEQLVKADSFSVMSRGQRSPIEDLPDDFLLEELMSDPEKNTDLQVICDGVEFPAQGIRFPGIHRTKTSFLFSTEHGGQLASLHLDVTV